MLSVLFRSILNMSITAGIMILAVLPARLALKRAPKIFSYLLWGAVLFRLLCPVSLSSDLSLLRFLGIEPTQDGRIEYLSSYSASSIESPSAASPAAISGSAVSEDVSSGAAQILLSCETDSVRLSSPSTPVSPLSDREKRETDGSALSLSERIMRALPAVWLAGMTALLAFNALQVMRLRRRLIGAMRLRGNIYLADHISMPFVMGTIFPKIYLPSSLSGEKQNYIIAHEKRHITRGDHLIKLLAFTALCIHWFNPLVWLAFVLSCKDMEMSCDEAVLRNTDSSIRADYSDLLLDLSAGHGKIIGTPLAFGEISVKGRIRNIMRYRRPTLILITAAFILCITVSVTLLCNPRSAGEKKNSGLKALHKITAGTHPLSELAFDRLNEDILPKGTGCNLLYEDENFIIFEPYIGLFGYDLQEHRLLFSVDFMKAFGVTGEITGEYGMNIQISADGAGMILSYIDPAAPDAERIAYYIDTKAMTYHTGKPRQMPQNEAFSKADIRGFVRWDPSSYRLRYFREYQNHDEADQNCASMYPASSRCLSSWSLLNEYDEIPEELLTAQSLDAISYTPGNPPDLARMPAGMFRIAYESDDFVIFYGDPGLFGYDLVKGELVFGVTMPWVNISAKSRKDLLNTNMDVVRAYSNGTSLICFSYITQNEKYGWNAYYIDVPSLTYTLGEYRDLPTENLFDPHSIKGSVLCPDGNLANTVYIRKSGCVQETWHVFAQYAAPAADPV